MVFLSSMWLVVAVVFVSVRCNVIEYSVDEERAPVILGNVADDSNIELEAPPSVLSNMQYRFLSVGGSDENSYLSSFYIQNNTGTLSVKSKLDREALCLYKNTCVLSLRIGASSGAYFKQIDVQVTVLDINDNSPEFSKNSTSVPISEDSNINSTFPIISAHDKDIGLNSKLSYNLVPDSGVFALDVDDSGDRTQVSIRLKQKLNREAAAEYQIYVIASDGGNPLKTGRLIVNIKVGDINDNDPVFTQKNYNVTLMEDVAMDTVIVNVNATDSDEGKNAEINYEFSSLEASSSQFPFSINQQTGQISIVRKLNFAPGKAHQVGVRAYDNGYPSRSSLATVTFNVIDTNNHVPEIAISQLLDGKIPENSKKGTVLAYVAVTDRDIGLNAKVQCSIKTDGPFQIQKLIEDDSRGDNSFNVIVSGSLDRERQIEHVVTIECNDSGSPQRNQTSSFIIQVQDQNDNPPVFSHASYNATISENNRIGAVITKVTASDADEGINAQVYYFLEPRVANIFSVDPNTGLVKANVRLDRESNQTITFIVYARDGGSPKYTSSTVVRLTILDENDEFPTFRQPNYTFTIMEEESADTYIGTITAYDNDTNENGKITFAFASQYHRIDMPFTIFPYGEIRTKRPLNREVEDQYKFDVVATDKGVPSRNSSVTVYIKVIDINDNYPQFIYPTGNTTKKISHLSPKNSLVATIEAHDIDEGKNGDITYAIVRSTDVNLFHIDSFSGKIYLSRHIETADIKKYELYLSATDNGAEPKKTGARIVISVEYTETANQISEGIIGQNVLIAITIACVTVVLSLAIIVTIFLIRRVDTQRKHKGLPHQEADFQIAETLQLQGKKSCLTKDNPKHPTYEINHLPSSDVKKEVSFSMDDHRYDHRDSGIFMIAPEVSGGGNPLSTKYSAQLAQQMGHHHSPPISDPSRSSSPDTQHEELHRMASIRLHQKLLHSYNKPLVYHPDENRQLLLMKKGVEDTRSDGSGEVTTIDSGRGGSEEDIRRSSNGIMI
ncbi:hypothetical protein KUTeg_011304 [Tegillarca granosa]|uniref:Cadherin domain-containing protein n=1 Tax=Tegillarca granosa TaxID=220873 RepID=A0ABQ9F4J8_TEGGR|nr:hypothetical protein KUTeg_011304 [Tegillarca granosa]